MKKSWSEKVSHFKPTNYELGALVAGSSLLIGYISSLEKTDDTQQFLANLEAMQSKMMESFRK